MQILNWCPGVKTAARFTSENEDSIIRVEIVSILTIIVFFGLILYAIGVKPVMIDDQLPLSNCTVYEYNVTLMELIKASGWSHHSLMCFPTGFIPKEHVVRIYLNCRVG